MTLAFVLSCEHAVNTIPPQYASLFAPYQELLNTHQGVDFGALSIARHLKQVLACDLIEAQASRLLIDCNRSLSHPSCFSKMTQLLSIEEQKNIIEQYYLPFRNPIIECIKTQIQAGHQVCHLSLHSFTPVLNKITRNADLAFLYDPRRSAEKKLSTQWKQGLKQLSPQLRVRLNYPYKGISDGLTTALRQQFTQEHYLGIEIEINQQWVHNENDLRFLRHILESLFSR